MEMNSGATSLLPPLVVVWPLIAAALAGVLARAGCGRRVFDVFVTLAAGLTLAGVVALIPPVLSASRIAGTLPFGQARIEFIADPIGVMFALAAALVWFCATLYATAWLRKDSARVRFQVVSLVLLAANLGVVLAGDLLTLYICFEVLGIVALLLVVHDGTETARRAGVKYFWMIVLGGISLLAGILLFHALTGSFEMTPAIAADGDAPLMWSVFALLLVGFGVKAGMVPLHIWLPDAHPVAPPPASALLSGVMIKTGAYGIFRVLDILFAGESGLEGSGEPMHIGANMGLVVLWLGLATMLIGVVLALGQHHAKRMLAWHSVSQMGFILTGLGTGAYLGAEGAMASAGGLLHVVNHGLFKGALFLGAGAVVLRTGVADMYRLGGLWRRMPVTFACMLVAAAGITGMPLFNGFVSKCMIHHGLVEAAGHGGGVLLAAEWIFLATCAGTFASFVKFIGLIFLRRSETDWDDTVREAPAAMQAAMIVLTLPVIAIGMRPQWLLEGLITPGLAALGVPTEPVPHYLSHYFLSATDLYSFAGMAIAGVGLFVVGMRYGLFKLHAPNWVGVDYWYRAAGRGFIRVCHGISALSGRTQAGIQALSSDAVSRLISLLNRPEEPSKMDKDRDFKRLDGLRDRVRTKAEELARERKDELSGSELEGLVNSVSWVSGLLATQMLERAMASFARTANRQAVERWFSEVEDRTGALAESALRLAVAWRDEARIGDEEMQACLTKTLPQLPGPSGTDRETAHGRWRHELHELVFRPGHHHWPVTESLDRGRLAEKIRDRLEDAARNLTLALALVLALLVFLLIGSIR
ncbi:MAG: NADH dehydrogenase [Wenzhouxiangellaceae bacterium]|nr:NADH dehydrogenase [Wenzhouxiangellaceae bacterium]